MAHVGMDKDFTLFMKPEEPIPVNRIAVDKDRVDAVRIPYVGGRISVENDDVGTASGSNQAKLIPAELECVVVGGRGQCLAG